MGQPPEVRAEVAEKSGEGIRAVEWGVRHMAKDGSGYWPAPGTGNGKRVKVAVPHTVNLVVSLGCGGGQTGLQRVREFRALVHVSKVSAVIPYRFLLCDYIDKIVDNLAGPSQPKIWADLCIRLLLTDPMTAEVTWTEEGVFNKSFFAPVDALSNPIPITQRSQLYRKEVAIGVSELTVLAGILKASYVPPT